MINDVPPEQFLLDMLTQDIENLVIGQITDFGLKAGFCFTPAHSSTEATKSESRQRLVVGSLQGTAHR